MNKLDVYKVELSNMSADSMQYEFVLNDQFFADIDATEIQKGNVKVVLDVKRLSDSYELLFHIEGIITVVCDRCLDDMELPISSDDELKVKLGEEFIDGEDFVIVPESDGFINVAWFMYEFIALNIPIKHVHQEGQCNQEMIQKLNEHLSSMTDEGKVDDNDSIDPRWNELKKILNNN